MEKLFYEEPYLRVFTARVVSCLPVKRGFEIELDRTAFYPEGGGQPSDTGTLGEAHVLDVQERDGRIVHLTDLALEEGAAVQGEINWEERFSNMQQHSGEHIVSGLIHRVFGYDNVGFHMGTEEMTIDLNGPMTWEQLMEIERQANQAVWDNLPLHIFYPPEEELSQLDYRSKKELTGQVRLVRFPGSDLCACCGTHVTHTGEIGAVKILTVENFHEGIRLTMICGKRVMDYLNMVNEQNRQISVKLSAKMDKTASAVARIQDENFALNGRVHALEEEFIVGEAAKWKEKENVLLFQEGMEAGSVQKLADAILQVCKGRCAVFSRNADGSYKYAMGEKDGDLRQFTKEMNAALNGRGGGKPFFVQGSVQASEKEIRAFFENK